MELNEILTAAKEIISSSARLSSEIGGNKIVVTTVVNVTRENGGDLVYPYGVTKGMAFPYDCQDKGMHIDSLHEADVELIKRNVLVYGYSPYITKKRSVADNSGFYIATTIAIHIP